MKARCVGALLPVLVASACGAPEPLPDPGCPPAPGAHPLAALSVPEPAQIRLLDAPAEIGGDAPPPDRGTLLAWEGARTREWTVQPSDEGTRLTSPPLGAEFVQSGRLALTLTPGGARQVRVIPVLRGGLAARFQRALRTATIGLERDAPPDEPVSLEADLRELVSGNWSDAGIEATGGRLEILLPGADAARVRLDRVRIDRSDARYLGQAAAALPAELGGTVRPAWLVHGGASVRLRAQVPPGAPTLRWHDGALPGTGSRLVRIVEGERTTELERSEGDAQWTPRRASLEPWAGRTVTVELSTLGSGVGFFGEPRMVAAREVRHASPPLVLLYMIDTLRADGLGPWRRDGSTHSPRLDRLASEGVTFLWAISSSPWTKPAIPTLMTGVWPTTHRVGATGYTEQLSADVPLLQQRFRAAGWRSGSFSSSPLGSTLSGLERGFGTAVLPRHWRGEIGPLGHPAASQLHERLLEWLDQEPDLPAFAYVHTLEVHEYGSPLYRRGSDLRAAYAASVQAADRQLGELLDALADAGRSERLLLVVVSDHGESFGDHGVRNHGTSLFQSQVHIPLVFWGAGLEPARVESIASLADVAPTLLELAALPALPDADGCSLAGQLAGAPAAAREYVPSALLRFVWRPEAPRQFAVVRGDLRKLIRTSDGREWRFDLSADPNEERATRNGDGRLGALLEGWLDDQGREALAFEGRYGPAESQPIDAADAERLRALGYLD